ncbi:hypothetical protein ACJX0J_006167, partial [Zea mays]
MNFKLIFIQYHILHGVALFEWELHILFYCFRVPSLLLNVFNMISMIIEQS